MCDDVCFTDLTRREFGAGALAAGALLAAKGAYAADLTESEVSVTTADGNADAFFVHPKTGTHPGVLIWTDIMGLRPAFRDMGRRLASEGFAVLTPNPFYRNGPAGPEGLGLNFADPDARPKMMGLMGALTAPGAAERDAGAYIAWLENQGAVKKGAKMGTSGYCMGGPLIMRTAAAYPDKIGAAASFHGGGLATDKPESPHLMIPRMKAQLYIGVADNDDVKEPMVKDTLKAAFAAANVKAEIEVYKGADHGWCVPGGRVYNEEAANRAYGKLVALFKTALA
ncbi:MAG: dienelactone hydrolase family protein [Rhodospirillaceae bacterium]|nr:dienelactone hydrolase family protein [Rhodospirillaceae bacterium]